MKKAGLPPSEAGRVAWPGGVLVAVLVIVMATALLVDRLNDYAQDRIRAQAMLLSIEEDAAEEHIAADHALWKVAATEAEEGVAENRREVAETLDKLERMDSEDGRVAQLRKSVGAFEAAIDQELRLNEAQQFGQARSVAGHRVDPRFEALHETLEEIRVEYEDAARRAALIADVSTYAIIFLAASALTVVLLMRHREQVRRTEQEADRRSQERFRSLVQNASDVILIMGADQTVRYISPAVERVLGYKPEDVISKNNLAPVHPDDLERVEEAIARAVSQPGAPSYMELRLGHADGSWRHIESTCTSLLGDPAVGGIVFNSRDVTKRKLAEQALVESEERYRTVVEQAADALFVHDLEGNLIDVNRQACDSLGYTREELLTMSVAAIEKNFDPGTLESFWERLPSEGPVNLDGVHRRKDGTTFPVEVRVGPLATGGRRLVLAVARDATERVEAQQRLREAEEKYRTLVEQIPVATYVQEIEHNNATVYMSPQIEDILGYSSREYTEDSRLWLNVLHPDDRERVLAEDERTDVTGEPFRMEYRMIRRDGGVVWVQDEALLVRDEAGRPLSWQGVMLDVTERKRAEEALKESEARYRTLVEQTPAITYIEAIDAEEAIHEILYVSPQVEELLGYSREEWIRDPELFTRTIHPDDRERVLAEDERTERTGEPFGVEYRNVTKDGRLVWVRDEAVLVRDEEGEPLYWQGLMYDITEQKLTEEELRRSEARNRVILEAIPDLIFRLSREGEYLDFQANTADLYAPRERIVGRNLRELMPPEVAERGLRHVVKTLDTGEMQTFEYQLPADEGVRDYEARMVVDGPGEVLSVVRDVTESKSLQRRLEYRAFHDDLTGLPNRALFAQRLSRALARTDRQGGQVAVLFLDIDDFKSVNDSLGHWAGDELLTQFARRLVASVRPGDTAARFGGDEFVVLLEDTSRRRATKVAERTIEDLKRDPFVLEEREIFAVPSIGIAASGYAERGWEDLLRRADLALHQAKAEGKAHHVCFAPGLDERLRGRLKLEGELRRALERGEFRVFYQPKVSIESGEIAGMEALVRWEHPERGLLAPSAFLAVAEEMGLIVPIGGWVLEEACRQAKEWQERHPKDPGLAMSVNLSAKQFRRQDMTEAVGAVLRKSGLDPRGLTVEITEETAMEDARATAEALDRLKAMGVRVEVDDFGTGYSSLSYLKRFPVDYLKVDRGFVAGLGTDPEDEGIVRAVIELARTLGLEAVAEGVENGEQLRLLREMGCELAQGSYFWDPLSPEAAGELLAAYNAQT